MGQLFHPRACATTELLHKSLFGKRRQRRQSVQNSHQARDFWRKSLVRNARVTFRERFGPDAGGVWADRVAKLRS